MEISIAIANNNAPPNKHQKEFNRLTKNIQLIQTEIEAWTDFVPKFNQRVQTKLAPLQQRYNELRADMVRLLDRAFDSGQYKSKNEQKKLRFILEDLSFELINSGFDDLKPIFDKYSEQDFDSMQAESKDSATEIAREMISQMFGIDIDEDVDMQDEEQFRAHVQEKMSAMEAEAQERERLREERRANKPKTAKQLEREAKRQADLDKQTKSVREVYMDLVKTFHPDREPDETEKARKTAIMQRVTEAYENNDLLTLLQLQFEFERIDQNHLENMAEEKLRHFNKVLRSRLNELQQKHFELLQQVATMANLDPFEQPNRVRLEYALQQDLANFKNGIRDIKSNLEAFEHEYALKMFLKSYKIPKKDNFEDAFLEMFG